MPKTKGERSRERLFASAEQLFAEKGYHGTTISQIVVHAGLTQASFYLYFKSKEDILNEMLLDFEQRLAIFVDAGRQVSERPASQIEEYLAHSYAGLFQLLGDNANLTKIVFQETDQSENLRGKIVSQITDNMRNNQLQGVVRPDIDTELIAEAIVASVERLVYRYSICGDRSAEELGKELGKLLSRGILVQGGHGYAAGVD